MFFWKKREPLTIRGIIQKYRLSEERGTDKDTWHSYVEPYERLLEPFRGRGCDLLEIGVSRGGSALIWHDYLPMSRLHLVDVEDRIRSKFRRALDTERYSFDVMDAYSDGALTWLQMKCQEGFDIIIDDGPHTLESQLFVIERYLPLLKKGGVLIIEDIQDVGHFQALERAVPKGPKMRVETIDLRSQKARYDDLLFVVHKD